MNEDIYDEYLAAEEGMEQLLSVLRNIPENPVLAINPIRLVAAMRSIKRIMQIVEEENPDAVPQIDYDSFTGTSLLMSVKVDEFNVYDTDAFAEAAAIADTMDVIPLSDGNIEIGFVYKDVRLPVPLREK